MSLTLVIQRATMSEAGDVHSGVAVMDEEEFRAFYERTARPLWSYLSRITGDPHQADDVLQEAYYRFYRAGARHASESHRRNSLFRIATNVVRDEVRRTKHYHDVPLEEESLEGAAPRTHAVMPEHQAAIRTDLAKALRRLEPVQRQMLWLAYAQGESHEEIAEILGLRAISIRTMLLRARRKLAAILRQGAGSESRKTRP